jgi:tripartite-type tricarboxylate transporter receptor subunit TctC
LFAGFLKNAGLNMVLVPYRETNSAVTDLAEGRLQIVLGSMATMRAQVEAGKVRHLAVTNKTRAPVAPSVPTAAEAGYPDLTYEGLLGLFGGRDLPTERRDRIAGDLQVVATDPAVSSRLAAIGLVARFSGPTEFSASLAAERSKMEAIVKSMENQRAQQ